MPARTYEALVSSPALLCRCRSCGTPVLAGLSEGLHVSVDLKALDVPELTACAILGRRVFVAARPGGSSRVMLWGLTEWTPLGAPLVAEHYCPPGLHRRPRDPAPDPAVAAHLTGWTAPAQDDGPPPF